MRAIPRIVATALVPLLTLWGGDRATRAAEEPAAPLDWVRVDPDHRSFQLGSSGRRFLPRGFNYDHDETGRLLEDYWEAEWPKVESDFREMKQLGANLVRIHLQFGKFMRAPDQTDRAALGQLERLIRLAERTRLYLDLTGLGCYHKKDVPEWYDRLTERERWQAQARFWEAIAERCASSPAVFCYDLMNEPVVPGGKRKDGDWLGPPFAGKHFVQFLTLDQGGRPRPEIARLWVKSLVAAIRKHDRRHLVTVGLVDWSLDRPGLTSGTTPEAVAGDLDFLCVHIYPKGSEVDKAIDTLKGFAVGKPLLIEETFPLSCGLKDFEQFLTRAGDVSAGWVGFYWGKTPEELHRSKDIGDALMLGWLELFERTSTVAGP